MSMVLILSYNINEMLIFIVFSSFKFGHSRNSKDCSPLICLILYRHNRFFSNFSVVLKIYGFKYYYFLLLLCLYSNVLDYLNVDKARAFSYKFNIIPTMRWCRWYSTFRQLYIPINRSHLVFQIFIFYLVF